MTQEGLRRHVLRVLRMWRSWSIFSDDFLNGLQVGLHVLDVGVALLDIRSPHSVLLSRIQVSWIPHQLLCLLAINHAYVSDLHCGA